MFNGQKLKMYIEQKGQSYASFGESIGVSQAMVSYLIKGFKQPSAQLLMRISAETGYSMEELMCEEVL